MLAALSLSLPYLFGLGCLPILAIGGMPDGHAGRDGAARLQLLAVILITGVLVNHVLVLACVGLAPALRVGTVLSLACLLRYAAWRRRGGPPLLNTSWWCIVGLVTGTALFTVLIDPVQGWDARSIWFFHAKMIYYNGSVAAAGHWSLPSVGFSHPDYPQLVPILAAQTAFVAGYWNEYLPKLSLAVLLVPVLLAMVASLSGVRGRLVLVAVPLFVTWPWLKNGYMDGYLALYAGMATWYGARWLDGRDGFDLYSALLSLGLVLGLKNEGALFCLVFAVLLPLFVVAGRRRGRWGAGAWHGRCLSAAMLAGSGYLLWGRVKEQFLLHNDLQLGAGGLARIGERLHDGSLWLVLRHLYVIDNVSLSFGVVMLCLAVAAQRRRMPGIGAWFAVGAGVLYFCGIVVVYLATPYDLVGFHLPTGDRTMLPVHLILLVAGYAIWYGGAGAGSRRDEHRQN